MLCGDDHDEKERGSFRKKKQAVCFSHLYVLLLQNVKGGKVEMEYKKRKGRRMLMTELSLIRLLQYK